MKHLRAGKRILIFVMLIFTVSILIVSFIFFHVLPNKDIRAFVESWKDGNIDILLDSPGKPVAITEEEKEFQEKLLEEYGGVIPEDHTVREQEDPLLSAILQKTSIDVKTPLIVLYPCRVNVMVTGPDMVQVLKDLNYESYVDGDQLLDDVLTALQNNNYKEIESNVEVEIDREDDRFYLTSPSPEMVDALYGGIVTLYVEEEIKIYETYTNQE